MTKSICSENEINDDRGGDEIMEIITETIPGKEFEQASNTRRILFLNQLLLIHCNHYNRTKPTSSKWQDTAVSMMRMLSSYNDG